MDYTLIKDTIKLIEQFETEIQKQISTITILKALRAGLQIR